MKFAVDKKETFTVFTVLEDKLNSIFAPDLKTELVLLNNNGVRNIILDFAEINFVDSSGLSAILVGNRLCQAVGGALIISNTSENVMRLMKISQLDSILKFIPTVQEAQDYIKMLELERELQNNSEAAEEKTESSKED